MKLVILTQGISNTSGIQFIYQLQLAKIKIAKVIVEKKQTEDRVRISYKYLFNKFKLTKEKIYFRTYKLYSLFCNKPNDELIKKFPSINDVLYDNSVVEIVDNHNSVECLNIISGLNPDILLVLGARILKEEIFSQARLAITFHSGIVPNYKGSFTVFWAMYKKDWDNIGFSFIKIARKVDAGGVIYEKKVKINKRDCEQSVFRKIEEEGSKSIVDIIKSVANSNYKIEAKPQEGVGQTFRGRPSAKDYFDLALVLIKKRIGFRE